MGYIFDGKCFFEFDKCYYFVLVNIVWKYFVCYSWESGLGCIGCNMKVSYYFLKVIWILFVFKFVF